jgi:DNA (cytosine-5)-methyltransferase 3A
MAVLNVLSLFDGMSCGQQALEKVGIKVDKYFASEIDKHAIKVTMANYPNTIQLGSVVDVKGSDLPKIDLLIGGSPCQSFSFAGKRKGMSTKCETEILTLEHYLQLKAEGYEFEGQSYLFWEYMRLLKECKPKYFLLENVEMGEKWERVLSKAIGINGIHINSALVSAQNRKRIYWTNIGHEPGGLFGDLVCKIEQPKDRGILLKDILQDNPNEKYFISSKMFDRINRTNNAEKCFNANDKSLCLAAGYYKQGRDNQYIPVNEKYYLSEKIIKGFERHKERHNEKGTGFGYSPKCLDDKGNSLRANASICPTDNMLIVHNTMPPSSTTGKGGTGPLRRNDGKTYCLDTGNTNAIEIKAIHIGMTEKFTSESDSGKAFTIIKNHCHGIKINNNRIRRLTPLECERLQTVKDNYTNHVSDSQRYKMLGNGWTVEVIAHIFNYIK